MTDKKNGLVRKGGTLTEGVELLRYRISIPFLNAPDLDALYAEIADLSEAFCKTELADRALREWETSDDPQKRFRFPTLLYSLHAAVVEQTNESCSVQLTATLRRRGSATPLQLYTDTQHWKGDTENAGDAPTFLLKKKSSKRKQN